MHSQGKCYHGKLPKVPSELPFRYLRTHYMAPFLAHVLQGINAWCMFSEVMFGSEEAGWPPSVDDLVLGSHTFACLGTYCNYEGITARSSILL